MYIVAADLISFDRNAFWVRKPPIGQRGLTLATGVITPSVSSSVNAGFLYRVGSGP